MIKENRKYMLNLFWYLCKVLVEHFTFSNALFDTHAHTHAGTLTHSHTHTHTGTLTHAGTLKHKIGA